MMSQRTAVSVAAASVFVLAISFFMQKTADQRAAEFFVNAAEMSPMSGDPETITLDDITYTSLEARPNGTSSLSSAAGLCEASFIANAEEDAFVSLAIDAPCRADEVVRIHHMGLVLQGQLDASGVTTLRVPALSHQAVFIADFETGTDLSTSVAVSGLDSVDRIALQETGGGGLELHAREFGANYGEAGHVWIGANNGVGHMIGDPTKPVATNADLQIYSLPRDQAFEHTAEHQQVLFSIEAEITEANCGRAFEADLLQIRGGRFSVRSVMFEMPECDLKGDFLVLNNLIESLKIAQN